MKVAVIQSNYLPWKGYFDIINDVDVFCFYDEVKYTKNDWRNRNKIYSRNGLQWLTVPIYKDAIREKISKVKLADEYWQKLHYNLLFNVYKSAKYYHQLELFSRDFYLDKKWQHLSEFNQYSIKKIADYIGIRTQFVNSANYELKGGKIEKLVNLLVKLNATEYVTGPTAKEYLSGYEKLFQQKGVKVIYKNYDGYPSYPQLNRPFQNNVSIVDLIANVEKNEIPNYIWKWRITL